MMSSRSRDFTLFMEIVPIKPFFLLVGEKYFGIISSPLHEDNTNTITITSMSDDDSSSLIAKEIKTGVAIVGQAQFTVINGAVTIQIHLILVIIFNSIIITVTIAKIVQQSSGETVATKQMTVLSVDTFQRTVSL